MENEGTKRLDGQTVLVTGAGRGLGHGVARGLAGYGAHVLAVARTTVELTELAETVRSNGGTIETYVADLGKPSDVSDLISQIQAEHGGVTAVVNNAAILRMKPFREMTAEEFDETIEVNLQAPVRLIRGFLPGMVQSGKGAIINVTSGAGVRGFVDETDYCASKFGLEGFSYSLAMELVDANISVNLMSPGYRIKPTSVTAAEFEEWTEERKAEFHDPIDMADGFAFLCLQDGTGVTGQRFNAYELSERVRNEGWNWHQHGVSVR